MVVNDGDSTFQNQKYTKDTIKSYEKWSRIDKKQQTRVKTA